MSAQIPDTLLVSEILKPTGFDCPAKLQGKTFAEATAGDIPSSLEDNKEVTITENGTIEITPTAGHDYAGMKKVTASVNVAGGADIEANKEATIDVSTYTEPVEITPTAGKDGMAKTTVTLTNIPSGGDVTAYAWVKDASSPATYFPVSVAPVDESDFLEKCAVSGNANNEGGFSTVPFSRIFSNYARVSDSEFTVETVLQNTVTFTRDSSKDFTLWQTA